MRAVTGCAWVAAVLLCLGYSPPGRAASMEVDPVILHLPSQRPVGVFRVRNGGHHPIEVQVDPYAWHEHDGHDVERPSRALLVSPPIFDLPAGHTQLVRIGLRNPRRLNREQSYRVHFSQLPMGSDTAYHARLRLTIRMDVPVFVAPSGPVRRHVSWKAHRAGPHRVTVTAVNEGNVHVRYSEVAVSVAHGSALGARKGLFYVLPGRRRSWTFHSRKAISASTQLRVSARTGTGKVHARMVAQ